ncbi:MAG: gluconate 2-dehydrogenase subunit 3 family protein [Saprospiraceae bacterium]
MKRRQALQNIVVISSGVALLPACDFEQVPVYKNIPLERKQWRMLEWLTDAILPKGELEISAPESTADFVLTMVNDCYDPADVKKYVEGLQGFEQYLTETVGSSFKRLDEAQKTQLLAALSESETTPENIKYLYNTTRRLAQQHFTSTEYFLKNYLDYEFVPGRYIGCVAL